eukprot:1156446-Pelagomonas_calceolata.AAC.7
MSCAGAIGPRRFAWFLHQTHQPRYRAAGLLAIPEQVKQPTDHQLELVKHPSHGSSIECCSKHPSRGSSIEPISQDTRPPCNP